MKAFRHILHVTDPSPDETVRSRAVELAIENQASLTLMSVVSPLPRSLEMMSPIPDGQQLQLDVAADRRRELLDIAAEYSCTAVPLDVVVAIGDPVGEIVSQVIAGKHDLLVKSAEGYGLADRLLGSLSQSLMRLAPCPVWLLKPNVHGQFNCVVAAVDVSASEDSECGLNRNILEIASAIAKRESAALHVISVWDLWMESALRMKMGNAIIDGMAQEHEASTRLRVDELIHDVVDLTDVRKHIYRGSAAAHIRELVEHVQADLLVMGTQCRSGIAGFFIGNTAESVLADVKCSVLTIKPDAFVSPIEQDSSLAIAGKNPEVERRMISSL